MARKLESMNAQADRRTSSAASARNPSIASWRSALVKLAPPDFTLQGAAHRRSAAVQPGRRQVPGAWRCSDSRASCARLDARDLRDRRVQPARSQACSRMRSTTPRGPYGQSAWAGKPAGVIGASIGCHRHRQLRSRTCAPCLRISTCPLLVQPEAYIHGEGRLLRRSRQTLRTPMSRKFVHGWMDKYAAWVENASPPDDAAPAASGTYKRVSACRGARGTTADGGQDADPDPGGTHAAAGSTTLRRSVRISRRSTLIARLLGPAERWPWRSALTGLRFACRAPPTPLPHSPLPVCCICLRAPRVLTGRRTVRVGGFLR